MGVSAPCTAQQVIDQAISQLGVSESPANSNKTPYTRWYGLTGPWCAMFVSHTLHHAGFPIAISSKKGYAYCPDGVNWFKKQGAWAGPEVKPKKGWVIFFDFPRDGVNRVSHTGLVEGNLADGRVATIEGNTNGAGSRTGGNVMRHNRSVAGGIVGYGIIDYQGSAPAPEQEEDVKSHFGKDDGPSGKIYLVKNDQSSKWWIPSAAVMDGLKFMDSQASAANKFLNDHEVHVYGVNQLKAIPDLTQFGAGLK
jgi:hypothetical protein